MTTLTIWRLTLGAIWKDIELNGIVVVKVVVVKGRGDGGDKAGRGGRWPWGFI